jgi:hypothetical protein
MGREESNQQVKDAKKAQEELAHAKKVAIKDKQWAQGAKDTSKGDDAAAKAEAAKERKAAAAAQLAAEGGGATAAPAGGGAVMKKCKDCGTKYNVNSKKGCQGCVAKLLGGALPAKKKK